MLLNVWTSEWSEQQFLIRLASVPEKGFIYHIKVVLMHYSWVIQPINNADNITNRRSGSVDTTALPAAISVGTNLLICILFYYRATLC